MESNLDLYDDDDVKKKGGDPSPVISFKISHDLYKRLEKATAGQLDEAGLQLTTHQMARRLMLQALNKTQGK